MDTMEATDKVIEEFEFDFKTGVIFRALCVNYSVFGFGEPETERGLLNRLADEGLPNETINNALERWTDLVLEEDTEGKANLN